MPGSFHTRNVAQISNREISTGQNQLMLQNQIRGRSRSWNGCMNTHDQKPLPAVWEYRSWSATIAPFCVEVMRQEVSCSPSLLGHLTGTAPPATPTTEVRPVFLSPKVKTSSSHFSLVCCRPYLAPSSSSVCRRLAVTVAGPRVTGQRGQAAVLLPAAALAPRSPAGPPTG